MLPACGICVHCIHGPQVHSVYSWKPVGTNKACQLGLYKGTKRKRKEKGSSVGALQIEQRYSLFLCHCSLALTHRMWLSDLENLDCM